MLFKQGESYLIVKEHPSQACPLFRDAVEDDRKGLIVWRCHPVKDKEYEKEKSISTLWITSISTSALHIKPNETEQLAYTIEKFMKENKGCVVLLASVEYLINFTSFKTVLQLIQNLKDIAAESSAIFMVYVGSNTLEKNQLSQLKQELVILGDIDE